MSRVPADRVCFHRSYQVNCGDACVTSSYHRHDVGLGLCKSQYHGTWAGVLKVIREHVIGRDGFLDQSHA